MAFSAFDSLKHKFLHLVGALEGIVQDVLDDRLSGLFLALGHLELVKWQSQGCVEAAHLSLLQLLGGAWEKVPSAESPAARLAFLLLDLFEEGAEDLRQVLRIVDERCHHALILKLRGFRWDFV